MQGFGLLLSHQISLSEPLSLGALVAKQLWQPLRHQDSKKHKEKMNRSKKSKIGANE